MRFLVLLGIFAAASCAAPPPPRPGPGATTRFDARMRTIEMESGGRLGVALVDARGRLLAGHRADERFALCSTFKLLLAAMVLEGSRQGKWSLDESLPVGEADLVPHSPVSRRHLAVGRMRVGEAAEAIVTGATMAPPTCS